MSILLWGPATDPPLQSVYYELLQLGVPTLLVDQDLALQTRFQWQVDPAIHASLTIGTQTIDLQQVKAVYLRSHDASQLATVAAAGVDSPEWNHAIALNQAIMTWADLSPALVLNRPSAMMANHSKPYQLEQIRQSGFRVPQTLITTDPDAVLAFWQQHGDVIYKSISGIRSRVSRLTASHQPRLANLCWCPTQFQEYIPGHDYRVHVVGEQVFACEVISQADDYRYTDADDVPTLRPVALPPDISHRCQTLSKDLNLPLAGIDLRQTPTGEWVCFEVNPSPGFTYFQQETGHSISAAIAHLLASAIHPPAPVPLPSPPTPSPAPLPITPMNPPLQFRPLSHSWVALHPQPKGVVQFIGGAFFGTFPTVFYRFFLNQLFAQGYTILAFPFRFSFRHWPIASSLFDEQARLRSLLAEEAKRLGYASDIYQDPQRYSWVGHSLGCKYIALLELLSDPDWRSLLQTTLGADALEEIERSLSTPGDVISIKGQPSLLLAPNISDTKSAIPLRWLATKLDALKLGVLPTRKQTQTLIEKSHLFNLTGLISFDRDQVAGSQTHPDLSERYGNGNDVVWFVEQLQQKRFPLLTEEFPGKHLEPLGISFNHITWNPFGYLKYGLKLRFLEQGAQNFLKELYDRAKPG